jgi:hypothetical protein
MARADMESASPKRQSLQAEDKIIAVKELCAMRGVDDATKRWQALNPAIERSGPLSGNWAFVNDSAKRLANLCGMTAPLLWGLVIAYSASLQHEYSHYSQFVSELGERGSSTESIVRYAGFIVTGAMHVAYSIFLYATFRTQRLAVFAATLIGLNGLAHACAGVFSCDPGCSPADPSPSQTLHCVFATIGYFSFVGAAVIWGVVFRRYQSLRDLSVFSIVAGIAGLVFFVLMAYSIDLRAGTGMYQRLSSGVLLLWLLLFAARLWRLQARGEVR